MIISQVTAGLAGIGAIGLIGGRLLGFGASACDTFYTFAKDMGGVAENRCAWASSSKSLVAIGDFPSITRPRNC